MAMAVKTVAMSAYVVFMVVQEWAERSMWWWCSRWTERGGMSEGSDKIIYSISVPHSGTEFKSRLYLRDPHYSEKGGNRAIRPRKAWVIDTIIPD